MIFNGAQTEFIENPALIRVLKGYAPAVGKTFVGYSEALRLAREIPDNRGVIFTGHPHAEMKGFQELMELSETQADLNFMENTISIDTSIISFVSNTCGAMERVPFGDLWIPKAFLPIQAMNLGFVMFENAEMLEVSDVENLLSRTRSRETRLWFTARVMPDWVHLSCYENPVLADKIRIIYFEETLIASYSLDN